MTFIDLFTCSTFALAASAAGQEPSAIASERSVLSRLERGVPDVAATATPYATLIDRRLAERLEPGTRSEAAGTATPRQAMRSSDRSRRQSPGARLELAGALTAGPAAACELVGLAHYGQEVPGGGTLRSIAFAFGESLGPTGRVAFVAQIDGVERNQGVFTAGEDGLVPIAIGCGGGGGSGDPGSGCGDPSPIGGTFSGFFLGTPPSSPPINALGDVLFLADVDRGDSPRGLFLYQGDTGDIRKVVAAGDSSPLGIFTSIGPGSLNNSRQIVFLALTGSSLDGNLFLWEDGAIRKVAAAGDPAPGGGFFWAIGTERLGYVDGTQMPTGPLGAINDSGQISFRGYVTGGQALGGIFLSDGKTHQWYARVGEATPIGGTYADFWAPVLNNAAEVAFLSDVRVGSDFATAWFVGSPGNWRKAIAGSDLVDGRPINAFAVSRNPQSPLDDSGRLLLWVRILIGTAEHERLLVSEPDGSLSILVRDGDPTPFSGQMGIMYPWPSLNNAGQGTVGAATPGAPGVFNAYMIFQSCTP